MLRPLAQFQFIIFLLCLLEGIDALFEKKPYLNWDQDGTHDLPDQRRRSFSIRPRDFVDEETAAEQLGFVSNDKLGLPSPLKFARDASEGEGTTIFIIDREFNITVPDLAEDGRTVRSYIVPHNKDDPFFSKVTLLPPTLDGGGRVQAHGTPVASAAGGKTCGVAPKANLELVKVSVEIENPSNPKEIGQYSDPAMWWLAFDHVLKRVIELGKSGIPRCVVNISLYLLKGTPNEAKYPSTIRTFFRICQEHGVIVTLAGGNTGLEKRRDGQYLTSTDYWLVEIAAEFDNVIVVGGVKFDGTLWPDTTPKGDCGGQDPTIYAPTAGRYQFNDGRIIRYENGGTSLAAPLVAGVVASWMGINRENPPDAYKSMVSKIYSGNKVNTKALVEYLVDTSHRTTKILAEGTEQPPYELPTELRVLYNGARGPLA